MYKKSIKENSKFLIPFVEGLKYYGSNKIEHALGTMIVLNDKGDILTCKHIAEEFIRNDKLGVMYGQLMSEINNCKNKDEINNILKKYNIKDDSVVLTNINLPFEINGSVDIKIKMHKYLDIALIKISNVNIKADKYPIFAKELPLQGQSVCKLGFAFPEYDFFEYSKKLENIVMKKDIVASFPLFPMDGIVTRLIMDENNNLSMFETSTPGIRGQSGGPVFSPEGLIYGMQSMTKQLDLNFDVKGKVKRGFNDKNVHYTPFINLGVCISSKEIIRFLDENGVEYKSE